MNAVAAGIALAASPAEIRRPIAVSLLLASLATVVIGWLVWRGSRAALYLALGVFEVLLIARLVTTGGNTGTLVISLVVLVVLVGVLWWAATQVRRRHRAVTGADRP